MNSKKNRKFIKIMRCAIMQKKISHHKVFESPKKCVKNDNRTTGYKKNLL